MGHSLFPNFWTKTFKSLVGEPREAEKFLQILKCEPIYGGFNLKQARVKVFVTECLLLSSQDNIEILPKANNNQSLHTWTNLKKKQIQHDRNFQRT